MDDAGRLGEWSSSDRFKTATVYVGQIDLSYKLSVLELCAPSVFPRAVCAGLESAGVDILFGTVTQRRNPLRMTSIFLPIRFIWS